MLKISALLLTVFFSANVLAQAKPPAPPKPEDFIKARQGLMRLQLMNRLPLNAVAKGEAQLTDATVAHAENLADLARMAPMVFADKTLTSEKYPNATKAKADIFSNEAEFKPLLTKHMEETVKLAQIAKKKDQKAFVTQLKVVADNCNACHDKFREE